MANKKKKLEILRHSAAHLAAQAVLELYPDTILTLGPATPEGFFYDMQPKKNFSIDDLPKIEAKMHELAQQGHKLEHKQIPKEEARVIFKDNPFKLELIDGIEGDTVGISSQGTFFDLCRGGHVDSTADIKHFKLTGLSGAYWRADKNNEKLQRISGTAFLSAEDMKEWEDKKEEAAKYDHRKLGKQLDLFSFNPSATGFVFFHPKGKKLLNNLTNFLRHELDADNYQEIQTPLVMSDELWRQSGHYDFYKDNMYFTVVDEKSNAIRPMNCPGSILIYKERPRSYRELPLKLAEFGLVHRYELSGVLHGLFRVRAFTIDDAHIYCMPTQIESEILKMINLIYKVYKKFDFTHVKVAVSTKPENAMGDDALWDKATNALTDALKKAGIEYKIQEGEGAFYGPKIEFVVEDSMGREWQCGTIQVDFFQAENFDLSYISSEGKKERPVVLHRAIYGSLERFLGILTEHYKGNFPFWLAPLQVQILTITDEQLPYAEEIAQALRAKNVSVVIDDSSDPISGKIKAAQLEKTPWMLVLGKKEVANKTITLRHRDGKQEFGLTLEQLFEKIDRELS